MAIINRLICTSLSLSKDDPSKSEQKYYRDGHQTQNQTDDHRHVLLSICLHRPEKDIFDLRYVPDA